jgi:hypothetical protein
VCETIGLERQMKPAQTVRREHAEHAKAMEKAAKPKTLNEMLDELDLEVKELD